MEDLGDDAEILSARRVRRGGVGGFFAHEHVEVSARRTPRTIIAMPQTEPTIDLSDRATEQRSAADAARAMAFEQQLQQMVQAVELEETANVAAPETMSTMQDRMNGPMTAALTSVPHRLTDDDLVPLPPAPPPEMAPLAPEPARAAADFDDRPARRAPRRPASHRKGPQWSITNLRRLGVAEDVLRRIVAPQPATDTAWTVALERAITDSLPTGESRDRIAMHGYGAESAVTLLSSALRGHRVDYIHLRERTAPASPFELALAIRSCLCQ